VGDFGFATKVEAVKSETKQRAKTVLGTPLWMAPEIHRREQYSSAVDIWAVGIVALEMAEVIVLLLAQHCCERHFTALVLVCLFLNVLFEMEGSASIQGSESRGNTRTGQNEGSQTQGAISVCCVLSVCF
jgi:serine/threonine protein kinase